MSTLMDRSSDNNNNNNNNSHLISNLKETELRLGLPGSESPERKARVGDNNNNNNNNKGSGFCVSPSKNFVSGAKRGFCDAIDGKRGLYVDAAEPDFCKPFSPGYGNGGLDKNISHKSSCLLPALVKEVNIIMASSFSSPKLIEEKMTNETLTAPPASKAQVIGWPPIRSFRKNTLATNLSKNTYVAKENSCTECLYVKVSMDVAPYLRKVDLKTYSNYAGLSSALEKMFSCFTIGQCTSDGLPEQDGLSASHLMDLVHGSEYVLTYEDKDGDWMLVGDIPWDMFRDSCKRLRIMKGSEAIGLAPRVMEKCRSRQ